MKTEHISDAMNHLDEDLLEETQAVRVRKKHGHSWMKWTAAAACLAVALGVGIPMAVRQGNRIELSGNSVNVTARYTNRAPATTTGDQVVYMTEEELFTAFNTAAFRGTVTKIENIELDFNGQKNYRAIAEIAVEEVYRGPCAAGDTVTVLLPCPVNEEVTSENEIAAAMREGMAGIFMPIIYDDTSIRQENGATLMLKDIADYGLADGSRFTFLETADGLLFSREAYRSIADTATLDEVEEYIRRMIAE